MSSNLQRVVRFMSYKEALAIINKSGPIYNETQHGLVAKTNSVGFCFHPVPMDQEEPLHVAARKLSGIADMHYGMIAIIDLNKSKQFKKGWGFYLTNVEPRTSDIFDEYSATEYSHEDLISVEFFKPDLVGPGFIWSGSWKNPEAVQV